MLTVKQGIMLSAIIGKMGLTMPESTSAEQIGADLLLQLLSNAYKAEKEICAFIASVRGCTAKEAEEVDLIEFIRELLADAGARDFLSSAVASATRQS